MDWTQSGTDGHTDRLTDGRTVRLLYASQSSFVGIKIVDKKIFTFLRANLYLSRIMNTKKNIFLISEPKHMLWVLKRTVSIGLFF